MNLNLKILILFLGVVLILFYLFRDSRNKKLSKKSQSFSTMLLWEEEFLMIEITSAKNYEIVLEEIQNEIRRDSKNKTHTSNLNINKTELSKLLSETGLKKYNQISYLGPGYNKILDNPNSIAYGSLQSAIFFDGKNEVIENIWLSSFNWKEINQTNILDGLYALGTKYDMILVDYHPVQNKIINLKNKLDIEKYLESYIIRSDR